jgi:hypothetical protein
MGSSRFLAFILAAAVCGATFAQGDECGSAVPLMLGTNPAPAASGNFYSLAGFTLSAGWPVPTCDTLVNYDGWHSFVPAISGLYQFDQETPAGFAAGALTGSVFDLFPDTGCAPGVAIVCDDDAGIVVPLGALITANLTAGSTYYLRVSFDNVTQGDTYYLNVTFIPPPMTLSYSSPFGPGSIQIDIANGPSSGTYFLAVNFSAGNFPFGWFYGVDITFPELAAQAAGAPFVGPLDPSGNVTLGPIGGAPPLTLYSVAVAFDTAVLDVPSVNSDPEAYTIP